MVVEIWSNFGFCGVVFESLVVDVVVFLGFVVNLWVSVGFFASACGFFFFFSMVVAGMDMGLLGWCFFSGGGGWGGLRVIERKREKEI